MSDQSNMTADVVVLKLLLLIKFGGKPLHIVALTVFSQLMTSALCSLRWPHENRSFCRAFNRLKLI